MTFSGWACGFSCAPTMQVHTIRAVNSEIGFLIDIDLFSFRTETHFCELNASRAEAQYPAARPGFASPSAIASGASMSCPGAPESGWISSGLRDRSRLDTY